MKEVIFELELSDGWQRLSSVCEIEPPGSISSDTGDEQQVYIFGWLKGKGPGVWETGPGYAIANKAIREIHAHVTQIADLNEGDKALTIYKGNLPRHIRFRLDEGVEKEHSVGWGL